MEKEKQVFAYKVSFYCDKCKNEVGYTGYVGMSSPPKFQHKCKCGETYWLDKSYPTIVYK